MNIKNFLCVPLGLIALSLACISCHQTSTVQNTHRYFDIQSFFSFQAQKLKSSDIQVEKKLYLNGKQETLTISAANINWEKEFSLFLQCDLNKPSLLDAYEIDVTNTGAEQVIIYRLVNRNAPVVWMKVTYPQVLDSTALEIKTRLKSLMNTVETELWYNPSGYAIRKKITPRFWGKSSLLVVESRFIKQAP